MALPVRVLTLRVPFVGPSFAGSGYSPDDEILAWREIRVVRDAKRFDKFFVTAVSGDSLERHRIFEGDYLVARVDRHAHIGDLIIAHTPNGRVCKYLMDCNDRAKVRLLSGNSKYETLFYFKEDVRIIGVVCRVERDLIVDGREMIEVVHEYGDSRRRFRYQFF